jgi:hypothetical protein
MVYSICRKVYMNGVQIGIAEIITASLHVVILRGQKMVAERSLVGGLGGIRSVILVVHLGAV